MDLKSRQTPTTARTTTNLIHQTDTDPRRNVRKAHPCPTCDRTFRYTSHVTRHLTICVGKPKTKTVDGQQQCPICNGWFRSGFNVRRHAHTCQQRIEKQKEAKQQSSFTEVWRCPFPKCLLTLSSKQALERHLVVCGEATGTVWTKKTCASCKEEFTQRKEWNIHTSAKDGPICESLTTCAMCRVQIRWVDLDAHILGSSHCCTAIYTRLRPVEIHAEQGHILSVLNALIWIGFPVHRMYLNDKSATETRQIAVLLYRYFLHNHGVLAYLILSDMRDRLDKVLQVYTETKSTVFSFGRNSTDRPPMYVDTQCALPEHHMERLWWAPYRLATRQSESGRATTHFTSPSRFHRQMQPTGPGLDPSALNSSYRPPRAVSLVFRRPMVTSNGVFYLLRWESWLPPLIRYQNYTTLPTSTCVNPDCIWMDLFGDGTPVEPVVPSTATSRICQRTTATTRTTTTSTTIRDAGSGFPPHVIAQKLRDIALPPEWRTELANDHTVSSLLLPVDITFSKEPSDDDNETENPLIFDGDVYGSLSDEEADDLTTELSGGHSSSIETKLVTKTTLLSLPTPVSSQPIRLSKSTTNPPSTSFLSVTAKKRRQQSPVRIVFPTATDKTRVKGTIVKTIAPPPPSPVATPRLVFPGRCVLSTTLPSHIFSWSERSRARASQLFSPAVATTKPVSTTLCTASVLKTNAPRTTPTPARRTTSTTAPRITTTSTIAPRTATSTIALRTATSTIAPRTTFTSIIRRPALRYQASHPIANSTNALGQLPAMLPGEKPLTIEETQRLFALSGDVGMDEAPTALDTEEKDDSPATLNALFDIGASNERSADQQRSNKRKYSSGESDQFDLLSP